MSRRKREIFPQAYFVYVKELITQSCGKRSAELPADQIESLSRIKRERGESKSSPRWTPVSRLSDGLL